MSDEHEEGYDLVMPFTVVASAGGPYEDVAFCEGFRLGRLFAFMASGMHAIEDTVKTDTVAQLDLMAMSEGYTMEATETEWPEWSFIRLASVHA